MRRLALLVALLSAPLATAPACSCPTPPPAAASLPAPLALLPQDASLVAHVDLAALRASPLWDKNRALLEADPDARRTLAALAACDLAFDGLRALDLAVAGDGTNVAAVLTGAGVGEPDKVACLERQMPDRGLRVDRSGPEPVLALTGATGRFHDKTTIVFSTPGWDAAIADLHAGKAAGVGAGPLAHQLARVPADRPIWFVGRVPTRAAISLAPALSGLQEVRGALDLRDGLGVELALGMDTEERATATLAELRKQFDGLRAAGLPPAVLDRVALGQSAAEVSVAVNLTMAEISTLQALSSAVAPAKP